MSLSQGYESDLPKVEALGTSEKERASREENEKAKDPSETSEPPKGAGLQKSWDVLMKAIDTREDEQILCFHHFLATRQDWDPSGVNTVKGLWDHICTVPQNRKLMEAFFWPETLFMQKSEDWHGDILDLYEANWSSLEVTSQMRLVKRFSNSMLPFLEAQREDIGSLLVASGSGLKFFTFLHNEMVTTLYKKTSPSNQGRWMKMLGHMQTIHQLPPGHFRPLPGFFPIGCQGIVNDSATSEAVLRPFLDSYMQAWPAAWNLHKELLVKEITTSINTTVPYIQGDPGSTSSFKEPQQPLLPHSPLITSHAGLEFLTFVNDKFDEEPEFCRYCYDDTLQDWVDALEKVRVFCGLKSNYFKAVRNYRWGRKFYTPTKIKHGVGEVEASEVQQPGGDTLILDGQRVGLEAGPSRTQEETQDGVDGSKKEVLKIGTYLSEEVGSLDVKETDKGIGSGTLGDCQDRTRDENRVVGGPGADNNV
ncbi:hypothetical protein L218DRAFT_1036410 [Marasmius fiardii PR-910]|nr:hypothetical protein L218DRAFT_1036410 [Marasmius fiardii PR-910]